MQRIQSKITLTYVFLTVVSISVFAFLASISTQSYLTRQRTAELARRIDAIVPQLDSLSATGSLGHIAPMARLMALRVTLVSGEGKVILDAHPEGTLGTAGTVVLTDDVRKVLQNREEIASFVTDDSLFIAKAIPASSVVARSHGVRIIRISSTLGPIHIFAREQQKNILIVGLLVLLIVAAASLVISKRISEPMGEIVKAVEQIRGGNLDTRINIAGSDEISRVAQSVNEMVEKLKSDIVQLRKLERVRSEFLGNVSHELRTPIFSLQGFLETLLEGALDDPKVNREFVQKAHTHATRLNMLLGELITISHIESGEMKMSFRYFDLHAFLAEIVEEFHPTASNHNVALRLRNDKHGIVEVLGDKERLRVVLENLLENAIKYNRPGGEVHVSYTVQGETVRVGVADTGVGIPKEHQSRVFERFYRVDRNRSREVGGTGLGLAIVKHIVEAHGGRIDLHSEPGKGSVFEFSLKT